MSFLLDRRIADIVKGVEVASALLISAVGRVLVRVLRPYAKKAAASILQAFLIFNTVYRLPGVTYAEFPSFMLPELLGLPNQIKQ